MKTYVYENPFRPIHEWNAVYAWGGSVVTLCGAAALSPFPPQAFLGLAAGALFMGAYRGTQAWDLHLRHHRLQGAPLSFQTVQDVGKHIEAMPDAFYLGEGFDWGREQAQLVQDIKRADPDRVARPKNEKDLKRGQRWIHGLGKEKSLYMQMSDLAGHSLMIGMTGAGKTRIADTFITQAILHGWPVIVIDPKGDKGTRQLLHDLLASVGQLDRLVSFHPAFPGESVRIDPMRNFNRPSELASRVAALSVGEGGMDAFTGHFQMTAATICNALFLVYERPNLVKLHRYMEGGAENLLERTFKAYFEKHWPDWERELKPYLGDEKPGKEGRVEGMIRAYRERLADKPSREIDALVSLFQHNREHLSKLLATTIPKLSMLTSGELGKMLSPDVEDFTDRRPITDFKRIIENNQVCYIGLDSLADNLVGGVLGSLLLADLASVAGDIYNYAKEKPLFVFVDECNETINDPFITLMNKSRGAGFRFLLGTQTFADFAARVGSEHKARQIISNAGNLFLLRTVDAETQQYACESFPSTYVTSFDETQSESSKEAATIKKSDTEVPSVPPSLLSCLPDLEFFARIAGGRIVKGRLPIISKTPSPALAG